MAGSLITITLNNELTLEYQADCNPAKNFSGFTTEVKPLPSGMYEDRTRTTLTMTGNNVHCTDAQYSDFLDLRNRFSGSQDFFPISYTNGDNKTFVSEGTIIGDPEHTEKDENLSFDLAFSSKPK